MIPCNDLRLAVWSPDEVLIPLNIILLPLPLLMISSLVILKSSTLSNSSIFSLNSGIIDIAALLNVYLVNSIVWPA